MKPALALDLVSSLLAPASRTLRGIGRVELAYARHFLRRWPAGCYAVVPTPWGIRFYDRDRALRYLGKVESFWGENIDRRHDERYAQTKAAILGSPMNRRPSAETHELSKLQIGGRFLQAIRAAGFSFGRPARSLPADSIYLNVGQLQVHWPLVRWLQARPDIFSVFMVHDVTPIRFPQYHTPHIVDAHHRIVRNTARLAHAHIFPSAAARDTVLAEIEKHHPLPTVSHVQRLPVPDEFLGPMEPDSDLKNANYFLVCGAIDPHKNHFFLAQIWKRMLEKRGAQTPKLVFAGSPKHASEALLAVIREPAMREHVIVAPGLSTPGMRSLMISAKALLMPSIDEGFGLPIIEALAQGTQVISSGIAAHREAAAGSDALLLPLDAPDAWMKKIEELADRPKTRNPEDYNPMTWEAYFGGIESFLLDSSAAFFRSRQTP